LLLIDGRPPEMGPILQINEHCLSEAQYFATVVGKMFRILGADSKKNALPSPGTLKIVSSRSLGSR